jgi:glycosyltransferase involved in cell wall biosynthesis
MLLPNTGTEPLVSIVTPVFNGDKYLARALESVLSQTYGNWEHIIVDNCSRDRTVEIVETFARKDRRIRIHRNLEFVSAIRNHNVAFSLMSPDSRYCKVLHADDWMFPHCLSEMVALADAHPSVGIVGSYSLWNSWVKCDGLPYPSPVVNGRELARRTLTGKLSPFLSPSALLVRSDLIRNKPVFFNESHIFADDEAYFGVLQDWDFGFVHQILTFIRKHEDSLTSSVAHKLNTFATADFYFAVKFGPVFLTPDECRAVIRKRRDEYYRFLADAVFGFRRAEFWRYHIRQLKDMGCRLNIPRLSLFVLLKILDILLNPKRAAETLWHKAFRLVRCPGRQREAAAAARIPTGTVS